MDEHMKTLKTTITIEFEETLDIDNYLLLNPENTEQEAMKNLEEMVLMDEIDHVTWAAENRLPNNMKLSYKFKWEDE